MDFKQFLQNARDKTIDFWKQGQLQRIARITYDVVWNVLLFFIIIGVVGLFFGVGVGAGYFASLVDEEEVRSYESMERAIYNYEETSQLYFADNIYIGDIRSDLHREETTLDEVSELLKEAVIATEDEYFNEHNGVVPKAIIRALVQEFTNAPMQSGGSTLTQQLIKNQILTNEVSFERKAKEMLLALRIERHLEKDQLLEAYFNIIPYGRDALGRNIAGVQTAAQEIFGVDASNVNLPQAAYLAGLPQSPSYYTPFASLSSGGGLKSAEGLEPGITRMKTVLGRMLDIGSITEEEYKEALQYDITKDFVTDRESPTENYPYLVNELERRAKMIIKEMLAEEDGFTLDDLENDDQLDEHYDMLADRNLRQNGYQIHSTIDKDIYDAFQQVVKDYEYYGPDWTYTLTDETGNPIIDEETGEPVRVTEPVEAAGMLIENHTGRIISFVGGREYSLEKQYNFATQGTRPNGSTMKPLLVYGPAMEKGVVQPGSPVADIETVVEIPSQDDWVPQNYSENYHGIISARRALEISYNVPAARTYLEIVNENPAEEYLEKMGITTLTEEDKRIYSLSLGAMRDGIKVEENINAFSTFGNNGKFVDAYMIDRIVTADGEVVYEHESEEVDVFTEQTNYLMLDMMRGVITRGTANYLPSQLLNNNVDWAGKTGTSQFTEDLWFVATNPNVTFGTWLGYETPHSMRCTTCALSDSNRNIRLWAELVNVATEINPELMAPEQQFQRPGGVVSRSVCSISGMLPSELCEELGLITTDLFNANYLPTETDDSLIRGEYVTIDGKAVLAGPNTPEEFINGDGIAFNPEFLERNGYDQLDDITALFPSINREAWEQISAPATEENDEIEDDGEVPLAPTNLDLNDRTLSWDKSESSDVVGYRIFRQRNLATEPELIGSTIETEYSLPNIDGIYHVRAVDYFGLESSASEEILIGDFMNPDDDEEDSEDDNHRDDEDTGENEDENNRDEDDPSNNGDDESNGEEAPEPPEDEDEVNDDPDNSENIQDENDEA